LEKDTRLARVLSVDEMGTPLEELLQRISHESGIPLRCGRSCASQRLQIRLKERSLRALMEALAQLLPGAWTPLADAKGYRLEMDPKAVTRRERWWRLFLEERERALAAQRAHVLRKMREKPYYRKPGDPNPENSDGASEAQAAADQEWFRALPPGLQESIAGRMNDVAFQRPVVGIGTEDKDGGLLMRLDQLPSPIQEAMRRRAESIRSRDRDKLPWGEAMVRFNNGGIAVFAALDFPDGSTTNALFNVSTGVSPDAAALVLDHSRLADEVRRLGARAPRTWKLLADYQNSRVWQNEAPTPAYTFGPIPPRRAEVLQWLSDKADVEFVADYYSRPGYVMKPDQKKQRLSRPLKGELDYRAAQQDMSWKRSDDNIYLFRNNRWYRDDDLEIAPALAQRWFSVRAPVKPTPATHAEQPEKVVAPPATGPEIPAAAAQAARRHMDWAADIVSRLTIWQIGNGLKWYAREEQPNAKGVFEQKTEQPQAPGDSTRWFAYPATTYLFFADADYVQRQYKILRFYASLSAEERGKLLVGQLLFAGLRADQKDQAVFLLPMLAALAQQQSNAANSVQIGIVSEWMPSDLATRPAIVLPVHLAVTSPQPAAEPLSNPIL